MEYIKEGRQNSILETALSRFKKKYTINAVAKQTNKNLDIFSS